jgi:DtxR family Mn-dependent transcriptional regulator
MFPVQGGDVNRLNQQVSDSLEDYLETILGLERTHKVARVKDIADNLGVLRGSVTGALKTLAEKGLVNYEPYSFITLTPKGKKIAVEVYRRHEVLRDFLENVLMMEADQAEENACRMEHAVDRDVIDRLVTFLDYIHRCPRTGKDWIDLFVNYYRTSMPDNTTCMSCVRTCLERAQKNLEEN